MSCFSGMFTSIAKKEKKVAGVSNCRYGAICGTKQFVVATTRLKSDARASFEYKAQRLSLCSRRIIAVKGRQKLEVRIGRNQFSSGLYIFSILG